MIAGNTFDDIVRDEEILEILKKKLKEGFRLMSYSVSTASDDPMGFLGEHYKIKVEAATPSHNEKLSFFLKRIPTQVEHREYALKTKAFYKEVELYRTLFADLRNAQEDLEKPTKWCPEYFYSRGSDFFVLEDLSVKDYYMYPEKSYMDEEHMKASLKVIAAMHAASLVFEMKYNDGKVATLSPTFERVPGRKVTVGEIYSHLTFETEATEEKGHPGNSYIEAGIGSQVKIVEFLSGYSEQEKQLIQKKLPDIIRYSLQLVKTSDRWDLSSRFKNVFVHGDLWANNLLFRKNEQGKVKDALIIDFQLARYAPPAHDIMMFLHLVQSKKFLENQKQHLFEFYYAALKEELKKNSLNAKSLLPWETFLESCEFYDDLGLISKLLYFQLILAPSEITKKFLSSPELFTKIMMVDRTEMVVECFLKNEIFRTRITEALNDVIKKFILK